MSTVLVTVLFFALVGGLVLLPFLPALREWRRRTDAEPLRVLRESQVNIRHFAGGYRAFLDAELGEEMAQCRADGRRRSGTLPDGTGFLVVPDHDDMLLSDGERSERSADTLIVSCSDLRLPEDTVFVQELYADGSIRGGEGNVYRALLAGEEILLDRDSTLLRWLHAEQSVFARTGCVLHGRVSADGYMKLERGCRFERLHAPLIEFGYESNGVASGGLAGRETVTPRQLGKPVDVAADRWLVQGRVKVPRSRVLANDLVATSSLRLGDGVHATRSLKSHRDVRVGRSAVVHGSVVAERDVYIGAHCRVRGPIIAEGSIYIDAGVVVGTKVQPTTVSAEAIYIAPGTTIHGSVWAHREGWVVKPSEVEGDDAPEPDVDDEGSRAA